MSTYVMAACWPIQIPPTPKAVLISLADNANDHGYCWPSIATICARTCFGKTAVIEAIQWLEEHGLVVADRENGRHTKYQIKPNGLAPELFDATGNPSASRTGTAGEPVRQANRYGRRTGTAGGLDRSASRTGPVRQADTNRQEPKRTRERGERAPGGTRLSPDWEPTEADREFAQVNRPDLDLAAEVEKFRDHYVAVAGKDGVKADWSPVWRNWIRRATPAKVASAPQVSLPQSAGTARDWRQPSEGKLDNEINYARNCYDRGDFGDGPEAQAELERRIEQARAKYAAANEPEAAAA